MKVLFPLRFDAKENAGGDVTQAQKYAGFVRDAGGEAEFSTSLHPDALGFDLVHVVNLDRPETYFQVTHIAKNHPQIPIVLTPIHHSNAQRKQYEAQGRHGILRLVNFLFPGYQFREKLKFLARAVKAPQLLLPAIRFFAIRSPQKAIASASVLTVLQSKLEEKWCEDDYGIRFSRSKIIPNGFEDTADLPTSDLRDIDVIMIGRIESRKDHLSVLKALSGTGLKVFLVGALNMHHRKYIKDVNAVLARNPTFTLLGPCPHKDVLSLAARSKVYISTSWLETGCLGDLESFAAGCRVIASAHSPTCEILGDMVRYARPGCLAEIRAAVLEELDKQEPVNMLQRKEVLGKFLWKNLASEYVQIYRQELNLKTGMRDPHE